MMQLVKRLNIVAQVLESVQSVFQYIAGLVAIVIFPSVVAWVILQWTHNHLHVVAQSAVICVFFALLLAWAFLITGQRAAHYFLSAYKGGLRWPLLLSLSFLAFSLPCFAALSALLSDGGYAVFEPALSDAHFDRLQGFYLWHFLDSIPGLKIPETILTPNPPFAYKDQLSGLILLGFKLTVILPVIGSFAVWAKVRKEKRHRPNGQAGNANSTSAVSVHGSTATAAQQDAEPDQEQAGELSET